MQYDVFLSHSSQDKAQVRQLATRLQQDGVRVFLDEWEIQSGQLILGRIETGLQQAQRVIAFLSRHFYQSNYARLEVEAILKRDLDQQQPTHDFTSRIIFLRTDDAPMPLIYDALAWRNWRQPQDDDYERLLAAIPYPASRNPLGQIDLATLPHAPDAHSTLNFLDAQGHPAQQFTVESPYHLRLQLAEPAYLLLLAQGSSGAIYQLYPHNTPTRLPVGEYRWPGALFDDPEQALAFGNIGSEACYAYLSSNPLPRVQALPALSQLTEQSASHLLRALAAPSVRRICAQAQVRAK
jgi:hypothetical protein